MGLILLFISVAWALCNSNDLKIYQTNGHLFPALFRSFAGVTVSKEAFELQVVRETGLSAQCAQCYGSAYICGWQKCKWACLQTGRTCNTCLREESCTTNCDECTGFK